MALCLRPSQNVKYLIVKAENIKKMQDEDTFFCKILAIPLDTQKSIAILCDTPEPCSDYYSPSINPFLLESFNIATMLPLI